eukprot:scaffold215490_cov35-Tisochrysis_lutea.AAC.1
MQILQAFPKNQKLKGSEALEPGDASWANEFYAPIKGWSETKGQLSARASRTRQSLSQTREIARWTLLRGARTKRSSVGQRSGAVAVRAPERRARLPTWIRRMPPEIESMYSGQRVKVPLAR